MRCQHCSTAPGPAAARLHVLGGNIIQQASAVLVVLHRTISFVHQLMQQGAANFTQITGKNGVKVLLGGAGVRKVVQQRLGRRGGHRGPMLLISLTPASHTRPMVAESTGTPAAPLPRTRQAPAAVAVHWAVGVRLPPYSSGVRNCRSAAQKWLLLMASISCA